MISDYSIPHGLAGLGNDLILELFHEMTDTKDIRSVLMVNSDFFAVHEEKAFNWAVSPALSRIYSLSNIPLTHIEFVYCF